MSDTNTLRARLTLRMTKKMPPKLMQSGGISLLHQQNLMA